MAKLTDPDSLSVIIDGAATTEEVEIQTGAKTIKLIPGNGNLTDVYPGATSGVTGRCLYSFLKEEWRAQNSLNKFKFPIQMIYEAQFIWINGWKPANDATRDALRDAGFQEIDGRENACIISLGAMNDSSADQGYYASITGFDQTTTNFHLTGEVNENIQTIGAGGTPDDSGYLKAFLREEGKTYSSYNLLTEQGLSALTYQAYRMPLANAIDIKINRSDAYVDGTLTTLSVDYLIGNLFETAAVGSYVADDVVQDGLSRWYRCTTGGTVDVTDIADIGTMGGVGTAVFEVYPGERQIGTNYYAFNRIIDCDSTLRQDVYNWAQRQLRKTTDINANTNLDGYGTVNGNVAVDLAYYVGEVLHSWPGVYFDNYNNADTNDIRQHDITVNGGLNSEDVPIVSTERTYPYVSTGDINFTANIVGEDDATTRYTMYFNQHSTRTSTDLVFTAATGANVDIGWTGTTLDHIQSGDYLTMTGFITNAENNGLYLVASVGVDTLNADKVDGINPANDAVGESITTRENAFETLGATIVKDNSTTNIDGQVTAALIPFTYDYSNNVQRGAGTNNTDASVTLVAIAHDGSQYITVGHTITQTTGQTIAVSPVDELNYSNPV